MGFLGFPRDYTAQRSDFFPLTSQSLEAIRICDLATGFFQEEKQDCQSGSAQQSLLQPSGR